MLKSEIDVRKLVLTGMLAAVAGVLMSLEFSIPFMPPFYKIDFSSVPAFIAIFTIGPWSGLAVELIKIAIKLMTVGTSSMYVGETVSTLTAIVTVFLMWFIYQRTRNSKRGIVLALILSGMIHILAACGMNAFVSIPMYAHAMGMDMNSLVKAVGAGNPLITNLPAFIIFATIPFNIIKITLNSVAAYYIFMAVRRSELVSLKMA